MRIFALSDIHIDYPENKDWLLSLSHTDYREDILIFAGDISDKMDLIEITFHEIKRRFKDVFYVPGNHDVWVGRKTQENSVERFHQIMNIAKQHNIFTQYKFYEKFVIIPILGWYDYSLGEVSPDLSKRWADFYRCIWPDMNDQDVTQYFLQQNVFPTNMENKKVISFSHFLPRIDLIYFGKITKFLAPVLGSQEIEKVIRNLSSNIHIYGHSHINVFKTIDDVLYINNAFGYPHETHITAKKLLDVSYHLQT